MLVLADCTHGIWVKCEKKVISIFHFRTWRMGVRGWGDWMWMSEVERYWQLNGQVSFGVWHFNFAIGSVDNVRRQLLSSPGIHKTNRKQQQIFLRFWISVKFEPRVPGPKILVLLLGVNCVKCECPIFSKMDGFRWHDSSSPTASTMCTCTNAVTT